MLESVLCNRCDGRGKIYVAESFVTCPACGGEQRVMKARPSSQRPAPIPKKVTRSGSQKPSSGGNFIGGLVVLALLGAGAWHFITELALPTLSEKWPWIIWYFASFILAFGALVIRASNLKGLSFIPEITLVTLVSIKLYLGDFWSIDDPRSPTLSAIFILSCSATSIFFMFYKRQPWFSKGSPIDNPLDSSFLVLILYFPFLAVLFVFSVLATPLEFWSAWEWLHPYILPSFSVTYPPCVAYFYRSNAFL